MAYDKLPSAATLKPAKYEASVPQQKIDDFKTLLRLSNLGAKTYENTTTNDKEYYGVSYDFLNEAKEYWLNKYDWRKTEAYINSFNNYIVDVTDKDGDLVSMHFLALYSEKADAIPITFIHGWPGSFLEFLQIVKLVKEKYSPSDLPYHIIVPSLPGYGYSSVPLKNFTTADASYVINELMVGLGFKDGYIAQGGDLGSFVSRILAAQYDSCKAAHLNMVSVAKPDSVADNDMTELEAKYIHRAQEFRTTGHAYALEHATRPSTIGHVLSSSPLALLAWIAEKFHVWTDVDPSLDDILDSVSLYWYTDSFARGIHHYRVVMVTRIHGEPKYNIQAPKAMGYSYFPYEIAPVPVSWVKTTGNLVWFRRHEQGGHFAAMERPADLWADVDDFAQATWGTVAGDSKL